MSKDFSAYLAELRDKLNSVATVSEEKDIAILETSCTISTPLEFRESAVKTGETVYAIGSSLGLTGSLSNGIISSAEREVDGNTYIQTTAPISSGNSGGPLIDEYGKVVGITTASFNTPLLTFSLAASGPREAVLPTFLLVLVKNLEWS